MNKTDWEHYTEAEIERLPEYIRDAARETKNISDEPMLIRGTKHDYLIPMNYFTRYGRRRLITLVEPLDQLGIKLFLPDLDGYTPKRTDDNGREDNIGVSWGYGHIAARPYGNQLYINGVKLGSHGRQPDVIEHDLYGYFYYAPNGERVTHLGTLWIGKSQQQEGADFSINCSAYAKPGTEWCRYRAHNTVNDYYLQIDFLDKYLVNWRYFETKANERILSWRVKK